MYNLFCRPELVKRLASSCCMACCAGRNAVGRRCALPRAIRQLCTPRQDSHWPPDARSRAAGPWLVTRLRPAAAHARRTRSGSLCCPAHSDDMQDSHFRHIRSLIWYLKNLEKDVAQKNLTVVHADPAANEWLRLVLVQVSRAAGSPTRALAPAPGRSSSMGAFGRQLPPGLLHLAMTCWRSSPLARSCGFGKCSLC